MKYKIKLLVKFTLTVWIKHEKVCTKNKGLLKNVNSLKVSKNELRIAGIKMKINVKFRTAKNAPEKDLIM